MNRLAITGLAASLVVNVARSDASEPYSSPATVGRVKPDPSPIPSDSLIQLITPLDELEYYYIDAPGSGPMSTPSRYKPVNSLAMVGLRDILTKTHGYPGRGRLGRNMRSTADAVIIGGGVMGCSILYNLARQGLRNLVLLERDVIGSGGTGRSQGICRMHYSNPVTTSLAWESLKLFRNFEEAVGGPSGFVRTGYILVAGPEDREAMEQNVAMQADLGVNTQVISKAEAKEVAPMLDLEDAAGLAYEPESGYGDPYAVASTYSRRAREMGAEVYLETPVTDIRVSHGRVQGVDTSQGKVSTSTVVVAAGPWSRALFQSIDMDVPLRPVRHQVVVLHRPDDLLPDHPTVADLINELSFRPDSTNLTMIGCGEEETDIDGWNQGVDMAVVADAFRRVAGRCPLLAQAYFRGGWSGLFDVTPDWHPILDAVEGVEGLYCAIGFSGHGFKLSPMIGVVMAELITRGRATSVDITPLCWSRFREGKLINSRYRYRVLA